MTMTNNPLHTDRPFFMEPLNPVTTGLSPIRAPSPCVECPNGIKRSGSCHDCLNQATPHPPTPIPFEDQLRLVLGDDAVDRINNPVGMLLEDAWRRETRQKTLREIFADLLGETPRCEYTIVELDWLDHILPSDPDFLETNGLEGHTTEEGQVIVYRKDHLTRESPEVLRKRAENGDLCQWCDLSNFAPGSALCMDCYMLPIYEAERCGNDCGVEAGPGGICGPCRRADDRCNGCGLPGYGGEYCSRACMRGE